MAITALALALIVTAPPDPAYMGQARYPATSNVPDPQAVGGFAPSSNFPTAAKFIPSKGLAAEVLPSKLAVVVRMVNGGPNGVWLSAADGHLLGWLEARDGDKWVPIEYHAWYTCGNSYHRVNLPAGQQWTWNRALPHGAWRTQISWRSAEITSRPLDVAIPKSLARLQPDLAKGCRVRLDWDRPTLVPNDMK